MNKKGFESVSGIPRKTVQSAVPVKATIAPDFSDSNTKDDMDRAYKGNGTGNAFTGNKGVRGQIMQR